MRSGDDTWILVCGIWMIETQSFCDSELLKRLRFKKNQTMHGWAHTSRVFETTDCFVQNTLRTWPGRFNPSNYFSKSSYAEYRFKSFQSDSLPVNQTVKTEVASAFGRQSQKEVLEELDHLPKQNKKKKTNRRRRTTQSISPTQTRICSCSEGISPKSKRTKPNARSKKKIYSN